MTSLQSSSATPSLPGIKDVAVLAGVSVGTVSNVLNRPGLVASGTVRKVREAIETLGYIPNGAARQLREGRSRSIGMVVLDVANPYFTDVVKSVEQSAQASGLVVLVVDASGDVARERHALAVFAEQQVQGVLLTPTSSDRAVLDVLSARGIPVVLVDSSEDGRFPSVSVDHVSGGRVAVQHLIAQGCRRLMFVGANASIPQAVDRLKGAREAASHGKETTLEEVPAAELTVIAGRQIGHEIARRPASARPRAIFAVNDLLAIGIMQAFVTSGIRIPEEIALIGYDDIDFAQSAIVPLSSVRQPTVEIGQAALSLLLEQPPRMSHHRVELVPELVPRTSSLLN